jgi:hypothetical protein
MNLSIITPIVNGSLAKPQVQSFQVSKCPNIWEKSYEETVSYPHIAIENLKGF